MVALLYWKELVIIGLVILCGVLGLRLQTAKYDAKETKLVHEKLIAESELKSANIVVTAQRQRQLDAENYAKEINVINDKYAVLVSDGNRVQQEVRTYNTKLHTITRETIENYAKTASILYGECRSEYLKLGQYTSKVDAELDKLTTP